MNLTLYVPDREAPLIRQAIRWFAGEGSSLSAFVVETLRGRFPAPMSATGVGRGQFPNGGGPE